MLQSLRGYPFCLCSCLCFPVSRSHTTPKPPSRRQVPSSIVCSGVSKPWDITRIKVYFFQTIGGPLVQENWALGCRARAACPGSSLLLPFPAGVGLQPPLALPLDTALQAAQAPHCAWPWGQADVAPSPTPASPSAFVPGSSSGARVWCSDPWDLPFSHCPRQPGKALITRNTEGF